jgi:hypothetical protein
MTGDPLRSLLDVPRDCRWRPSPDDDPAGRWWRQHEEELGRAQPLSRPPPDRGLDWLGDSLVPAGLDAGAPDDELLVGDDEVARRGTDALAWYEPFHADPVRWGIYLPDRGIWTLAKAIQAHRSPPHDWAAAVRAAAHALYAHEYFHAQVEVLATLLESTQHALPIGGLYGPYREAVARAQPREGRPIEEAMANAYAWGHSKAKRPLGAYFRRQPHGYCDWDDWIGDEYLPRGLRVVLSLLLNPDFVDIPRNGATRQPSEALFDLAARLAPVGSVPVIPVVTLPPRFALRFIERIARESITHSRRFEADVRRAPKPVQKLLDKALEQLAVDARIRGLQFKTAAGLRPHLEHAGRAGPPRRAPNGRRRLGAAAPAAARTHLRRRLRLRATGRGARGSRLR